MTTGGAPLNAGSGSSAASAAAAAAARMASAGLSNAQAFQMQMNQQASAATQLQQRAAAAAQYLNSGQRKATSRDVQTMLEKNDAALRAWSNLHAHQPPKHHVPEHKAWSHKCLALRQQIGARLEVLASLADKQVAHEDGTSSKPAAGSQPIPPVAAAGPTTSAKKATAARIKVAPKSAVSKTAMTMAHGQVQAVQAQPQPHTHSQVLLQPGRQNGPTATSTGPAMHQFAAPLKFSNPGQSIPTQGLPTNGGSGGFYNSAGGHGSTTAPFAVSSGVPASASTTSPSTMPNVSSVQAFNPQAYASAAGYMGGGMAQHNTQFMNQPNPVNFRMGNNVNMQAAGMMNPQFMGMPMGGQMPMAMNNGAMYNSTMFNSAGYMGVSANHLPTDPFNASFQMQPTTNFNVPYSMAGNAQMMGSMGGFVPMQNAQMMMNSMAFNMGIPQQQQQQQQQQFQPSQLQSAGFANPSQQQQQLQQHQQHHQGSAHAQPAASSQLLELATSFSDDDSNIFDGLGDDAFLNME